MADVTPRADIVPQPKGFVQGIPRLFLYTAGFCVGRASVKGDPEWTEAGLSLAAIALSASAVESWIAEWFAIAKKRGELPEDLKDLEMLPRGRPHEIIKQVVKSKRGVQLGEEEWYREMRCLFELRNHLLHFNPIPRELGTFPEALKDCIARERIKAGGTDEMDWTSRLLLPQVASQAAMIAHASINALWNLLVEAPDGDAA